MTHHQYHRYNNYQASPQPEQQYSQDAIGWPKPQQGYYDQGGRGYGNGAGSHGGYEGYDSYDNSHYGANAQGGHGGGGDQQDYSQYQNYDDQGAQYWQDAYDQAQARGPPPPQQQQERTRAPSRQHQHVQEPRTESRSSGKTKPKERILQPEPESPTTIAWDSPFPVFGQKKKGQDEELAKGLGDLDVKDQQPRTRPGTAQKPEGRSESRQDPRQGPTQYDQGRAESRQDSTRRPPGQYDQGRNELRQEPPTRNPVQDHPPRSQSRQDTRRAPPPQAQYDQKQQHDQGRNNPSGWQQVPKAGPLQDSFEPQPIQRQQTWQEPGPMASHYGPDPNSFPQRPNTAGGARRPPPNASARSFNEHQRTPPIRNDHNPPQRRPSQPTYTPVTDQYYAQVEPSQQARREDMPNFDAAKPTGHRRGASIDHHLQSNPRPQPTPYVQPESDFSGQAHRSRSQPDLRGQGQGQGQGQSPNNLLGGFAFEGNQNPPSVPQVPLNYLPKHRDVERAPRNGIPRSFSNDQYQHPQRNASLGERNPAPEYGNGGPPPKPGYPQQRRPGPGPPSQSYDIDPRRGAPPNFSRTPTAGSGRSQRGPPNVRNDVPAPTSPTNPDALPAHPVPVRQGLVQQSVPKQGPKPPPVRQYTDPVQVSQAPPAEQAPAMTKVEKRRSEPVTHAELARLQDIVKTNPNDLKTQLLLAKKWVEAASVLADEGGRADTKTRSRNREKYIFDAHKLVKKLVNQGNADAMFYLADCHGQGLLGLVPDPKEAFSLYVSAAKLNHPPSAYRVAVCCEMGLEEGGGTRRDPLKAIQWYKRAATLKDTPAMYKMGMILLKGLLGQPKNPKDAVSWLKRAADRADEDNPHALHELGLLYESAAPNDAIIRDEQYSKQLFLQSADLGYKFSQYRLGQAYEYGHLGCPIDPRQSITWYSQAAAQEEHQSELSLSGWYLTGADGILQQSDTEAYLWARKAAHSGLAKAEYAMGYFTEVGIGAPANLDDAKRWYWRAASQNYPKARDRLEDLKKGGGKMQKKRVSRSAVNRQSEGECSVM